MQCQGRERHAEKEDTVLFCFVSECHFSCRKETIAQTVVPEAHVSSSKVPNKSIVEEDIQKEVRVCDRKGFAERSCSVCKHKKAAAAQEELANAMPREREREYSSRAAKKTNQVDVFEACQHQRFQQLTANPSCSHHQYFLLLLPSQQTRTPPCMYKTLEEEAEEEEGLSLLCYP
jgi:hypothetical protein